MLYTISSRDVEYENDKVHRLLKTRINDLQKATDIYMIKANR